MEDERCVQWSITEMIDTEPITSVAVFTPVFTMLKRWFSRAREFSLFDTPDVEADNRDKAWEDLFNGSED